MFLMSVLLCVAAGESLMAANKADINIVPAPVKMDQGKGVFELNEQSQIAFQTGNADAEKTAAYLASLLRPATGYALPANAVSEAPDNAIFLKIEEVKLGNEGYRLIVTKEGVALSATTSEGLFNGVQTLRQLLPAAIFSSAKVDNQSWKIPGVLIEDYPRFAWRGMMLDTARHFMPKEFIYSFIDTLALHKMNHLHLHLTDDQGWRIEIKKYPKLTEVGAWRAETLVGHSGKKPEIYDGKKHGGFYTQDELRALVAYAADRHITIIPEIEMPGHAQAAIASYPELGNLSEQLPVHTSWGVNKNIFNVEENTILFLQDVLAEVVEIFPSTYIHIGGDEAAKDQWKASEAVQKRMKELGLADEAKMQSYFIARMNEFLKSKGRKLIGWDEILDGGLGKDATVMAWRGINKAVEAAKAGNDVVMAPTAFTYLDYYQGKKENEPLAIGGNLPLEKVYSFDPMSIDLEPEALKHILGTQGQIWGEYIATPEHAEYMAFPRACALAEAAWTPQAQRNYDDFLARLKMHVMRLEKVGVNYRALDK